MDFKLFIDALLTGTPWAILAALVGIVWQGIYVRSRDKAHDEQIRRELELERQKFEHEQAIEKRKFEHQKELEITRFEYEQRQWREELSREITLKHIEIRLDEYAKVWSYTEGVARNRQKSGTLTRETTQEMAKKIKSWRYSKGGLFAETITRDAAFAFQQALWVYDESEEAYKRIRNARGIFRDALRADTGLGEIAGQTIYQVTEERQKIREELKKLQSKLGIASETEAG
ncbi:MAG: hypothetical protein HS126_36900 [Anaerolineales bacterium]|nr:hypothetical protein [Anaerolineales bacterium]